LAIATETHHDPEAAHGPGFSLNLGSAPESRAD
jgi:hypothetical protein